MHYNFRKGAHSTWSDSFGSIRRQITKHNWLPAATAGVIILWLGLLFAAINQTGPANNPGAPSDLTRTKSNPPMAVITTPDNPSPAGGSLSESSPQATGQSMQPSIDTSVISTPTPVTTEEDSATLALAPIIGGLGGDTNTAASTASGVPNPQATDPVPDLPSVNAPTTPEPVTVDTDVNSNDIQLDVDVDGGLL